MLSVNPKNRPTISYILERPVIKKRVASYIFDFIQSYTIDPNSDKEDIHIEILKEQAEKLGVFNQLLLKEINQYDENSEKAIKQLSDSKEQNFVSYENYLTKKAEEKKKIEAKILELEKQKKQIYANIRGRDIRKNTEKDSSSIEKKNYYENLKLISSSVERKKAIGKIDREHIKKLPKKIIHEADEFIKIKSNIGINNNSVSLRRPESVKKSNRLPTTDNLDLEDLNDSYNNINNSLSKSKIKEKVINTKNNYYSINNKNEINNILELNTKENEKNKRPSSGINKNTNPVSNSNSKKDLNNNNTKIKQSSNFSKINVSNAANKGQSQTNTQNNNYSNTTSNNNLINLNNSRDSYLQNSIIKKDDSFEDNILETIKEEAEGGKLNEDKTKIVKLTNEIVKMREYLDQMQNKIQVIEKKIVNKDKDKNFITNENDQLKDVYNESYLHSNEGYFYNYTNPAIGKFKSLFR